MKKILYVFMFLTLILFFKAEFSSQKELSCEGEYELILHDSNSGVQSREFSHRTAYSMGYNITVKEIYSNGEAVDIDTMPSGGSDICGDR